MELMSPNAGVSKWQKEMRKTWSYIKRYWTLYLLLLLPIAYFVIFRYAPMAYIQMAFKKFNYTIDIWHQQWASDFGLQYFIQAFNNRDFLYVLRNTILLNVLDLLAGFPAPILLAILLNELAFKRFKRVTQTIAYMPHFLSWAIIAGMALQLFTPNDGLVNITLKNMGLIKEGLPFLNNPVWWVVMYILLGIWQSIGWNTIIYLAAITGISPELYEAASVDGASRLRRIWHITLPGLRPTIVVLLIMSLGRILGSEFERPYSLLNPSIRSVGNVISIFVYENGIKEFQYSLSTAVGFFQSIICLFFLFGSNAIAKKFGERGVW